MTAIQIGLLTLYNMFKAVDRGVMGDIRVMEKHGGKSGDWSVTSCTIPAHAPIAERYQ